ncbi:hypothetical protein PAPYR_3355 [Paratrimastix pyriformis]|uniref:Uncharacterized protein n=1 Tax=Paratrimastix pyriformis TaxID=342808 RepID=A0ABQ8UNG5_9EUKA|nr:hypothetical protein PAPYR_3355 [Paratrimastix pyriformis]
MLGSPGSRIARPPRTHEASQAVYHADCDALFTTIHDHPPMNATPPKPAAPVRLLLRPTDCEIGVISRYSGLFPVPTAIFMHLSPDLRLSPILDPRCYFSAVSPPYITPPHHPTVPYTRSTPGGCP